MNNNFPIPITNETDLEFYEEYLKEEFATATTKNSTLSTVLKSYIGKAVKIDCAVGNRLESRIGLLTEVGDDFLTIKPPNHREIIINLNSLKFLNVLQNNTKLPHY